MTWTINASGNKKTIKDKLKEQLARHEATKHAGGQMDVITKVVDAFVADKAITDHRLISVNASGGESADGKLAVNINIVADTRNA